MTTMCLVRIALSDFAAGAGAEIRRSMRGPRRTVR
jgi:hypothetical protein